MIGKLLQKLSKKELVLYNPHRQILPLLSDQYNQDNFVFIPISFIWKYIPFRHSNKWKYRVMHIILDILSPKFILDVNWISPYHSLYFVWTKKNTESSFIVLQHGSYVGGVVTDIVHRYTKCDVFLTWSDYFTNIFQGYNKGKRVQIKTFGNSVFNEKSRDNFEYSVNENIKRVLFAPSAVSKDRKVFYLDVIEQLSKLGFEVLVKEHNMQTKLFGSLITPDNKVDVVTEFKWTEFDLFVTDISSFLLDAIYHKGKVLFCYPFRENEFIINNIYSKYLKNSFPDVLSWTSKKDLTSYVDKNKQEELFKQMLTLGNNQLTNL